MSFLVLIILVIIEKFSNGRYYLQKDSFWLRQLHKTEQHIPEGDSLTFATLKLTLLPVIIIGIAIFFLHSIFHGIFLIFIDVAIMLYALGRKDLLQRFGSFKDAWRRNDIEGLKIAAERDLQLTEIDTSDPEQLLQQSESKLLWYSYEGFFAVIFWYMLCGPLIPLFYRLTAMLEEHTNNQQLKEKASTFRYYLDWLPSRILIYSFCLIGHFTASFEVLVKDLFNKKASANELITKAGLAAIQAEGEVQYEEKISSLDILWSLVIRSAMLWYAIYALIIIFIF